MLENVKNYDESIPKGKFGFAGFQWGLTLVIDYLFGFSLHKDADGKVLKKLENNSLIGTLYKSLHKKCVTQLQKNNPNAFASTFEIPTIKSEYFNKEFFDYWRKEINMPIIVKDFLKGAPIMEEALMENFIKNKGEQEVQCVVLENKEKNRVGQNIPVIKTSLKDYLTLPRYKDYYLNNFYGIFSDEDFNIKCKGNEIDAIQGQENFLAQWFISRGNTVGSSLHCAGAGNMFLNIAGKKQWDFIDPSYSSILQASVSKYGAYAVSEMIENFIDEPRQELHSGYPHMKHVPFYSCVLEEGDMLYNPDFWWHSVRNLSDYNVGCATRYGANSIKLFPISLCMILDMAKHPTKSSTIQVMKIMKGKQSKTVFNDIIFTDSENKEEEETTVN